MFFALPLVMLVVLIGLGSLAAIVFGIVYAIANKRPGVAIGSVLVPVLGFFAVFLLGMTCIGISQGYINGPVSVSLNDSPAVPGVPGVPAMPAMPGMAPMPPMPELSPLAIGDYSPWAVMIAIGLGCLVLFGVLCKGSSCESASWWRRKKMFVALLVVIAAYFMMLARVRESAQEAGLRQMEQIRRDQEIAQQKVTEIRQKSEAAKEKVVAAFGENFQEMFEELNRPRIQLGAEGATMTIGEPANAMEAAGKEPTKIVVPMSAETQESLARSAARLERLVEQVSEVADQVTDTGTLLGKAMVALNDRIDSRSKSNAAVPTPSALPQTTAAEVFVQDPAQPAVRVKQVAVTAVTTAPLHSNEKQDEIDLGDAAKHTIVVKIDRQMLAQAGLSFETLKQALSDEGLWNGKVVRFDEDKLQITATGHFSEDYLPRLKNTFLVAKGLHGKSIHLSDLAEVEAAGVVAEKPRELQARPAWVDLPPQQVGTVQRDVVTTEEYSSREECARASDVLLLYKTYEHLSQLLGNPRSEVALPSLTFYTESGEIAADGKTIYQSRGQYGVWLDPRLKTLSNMGVGIDFVRREMVPSDGEYYETIERSAGPMNKLYTQLEFRANVDQDLLRRWDELRRSERFAVVGAGAGSVLGLLGLALGLLKVDTWTKGYYSKRLFLGVPAAIIGVLALLAAAAG